MCGLKVINDMIAYHVIADAKKVNIVFMFFIYYKYTVENSGSLIVQVYIFVDVKDFSG